MAGYRFCRSDDVPLLVEAYNACYRVHFPELPPLTVDEFRRLTRDLNLWTSSCMVASVGSRPVGVMLAAKRDGDANWIHSLGVHPDHRRQGHGKHLLTSLGQKLAILGPRRMLLELPRDATAARRFVEACGYTEQARYRDFVRQPGGAAATPEIVMPITPAELVELGAFDHTARHCWRRAPRTLLNMADRLRGFAIPSGERIEAYVLYDDQPDPPVRRIVGFEVRGDARREALLSLLFGACASTTDLPLVMAQVSPSELDFLWLDRQGWQAGPETIAYATEARPG